MTKEVAINPENSPVLSGGPVELEERQSLLHLAIAEQGKLYALGRSYSLALFYYRKAMQMTVEAKDPEVFFRHYLECSIESLEHMGCYSEIFEYCKRAIQLYGEEPLQDPLIQRDLAHVYQRLGVVRLKSGDREGAIEALRTALEIVAGAEQSLPLATSLLRWLEMGLQVELARIAAEQEKTRYFSVRPSTVDPQRAIRLPDAMLPPSLSLAS